MARTAGSSRTSAWTAIARPAADVIDSTTPSASSRLLR
jgi:hypothetical protein